MPEWERYQFLRYYLPGFLFIIYLSILLIPAMKNIQTPAVDQMVGIFGAIIIASPVIGYLIYSQYNWLYEHISSHSSHRSALTFIKNAEFVDKSQQQFYKTKIDTFAKQKELIDLTLYLDQYPKTSDDGAERSEARVSNDVLSVLQNQLNNFSARVVCGLFTPIVSLIITGIIGLIVAPNLFSLARITVYLSITLIILVSISLLLNARKVLIEAFVLENYIIRSRRRELKIILDKIFPK